MAQKNCGDVKGATIADDLSKVHGDATCNGDVKVPSGTTEVKDGKVTVTYTVTGGGDTKLHNVVTTDDKRGTCDTEKGCETDHRVPPGKAPPP